MATYTMELRKAMEALPDIGLNDYPIFDEAYRIPLNKKITNHYYFREIGVETPEMFAFCLSRKMHEIMPEYNQFYLSERLRIDPFRTMSIKSVTNQDMNGKATAEGKSENESLADSKSRAVDSDTPQSMLTDYGDYATGAADVIGQTKNTATGEENSTSTNKVENNTENTTEGYSGSQADLLTAYRATFLNIDLAIIKRLDTEGMFMNIWSSGDSNFRREMPYGTHTTYGLYPRI